MIRAAWVAIAALCVAGCAIEPVDYGEFNIGCRVQADCPDGFACVSDRCRDTSSPPAGGSDGDSDGDGFDLGDLDGVGEHCDVRADCDLGLACHDNQCVPAALVGGAS